MIITWNTRKTAAGEYEFIVSRVGYQSYEVLKTGVVSSRAKAVLLGKKWVRFLKSQQADA